MCDTWTIANCPCGKTTCFKIPGKAFSLKDLKISERLEAEFKKKCEWAHAWWYQTNGKMDGEYIFHNVGKRLDKREYEYIKSLLKVDEDEDTEKGGNILLS